MKLSSYLNDKGVHPLARFNNRIFILNKKNHMVEIYQLYEPGRTYRGSYRPPLTDGDDIWYYQTVMSMTDYVQAGLTGGIATFLDAMYQGEAATPGYTSLPPRFDTRSINRTRTWLELNFNEDTAL